MNQSGLKPLGRAVLIEAYEPERKSGLIQLPTEAQERALMIESRAVVIEVGPRAWDDEAEPRAKPGDKVVVARFSGYMIKGTADGKQYRLVNDRDIFCGIVEEKAL